MRILLDALAEVSTGGFGAMSPRGQGLAESRSGAQVCEKANKEDTQVNWVASKKYLLNQHILDILQMIWFLNYGN